jgi:hypothetical protein
MPPQEFQVDLSEILWIIHRTRTENSDAVGIPLYVFHWNGHTPHYSIMMPKPYCTSVILTGFRLENEINCPALIWSGNMS